MPPRSAATTERNHPCTTCRGDNDSPCRNCKKSGVQCIRSNKTFRFKRPRRSKGNFTFDVDQTWLATDKHNEISIVDLSKKVAKESVASKERANGQLIGSQPGDKFRVEEKHLEEQPSKSDRDAPKTSPRATRLSTGNSINAEAVDQDVVSPLPVPPVVSPILRSGMNQSNHIQALSPRSANDQGGTNDFGSDLLSPTYSQSVLSNPREHRDFVNPSYTFPSPYYITPDALHGLPDQVTQEGYTNLQESCLIKHFIQNLAQSFDTTDRDRHFAVVVPQRAMFCPVLLYAILTASARHLTRKYQGEATVQFDGIPLPELNENSALHYHNICISYLMEVLNDPKRSINQDALIAATILRFHEQIDTPLTGWDSETYLSVIQGVIDEQQDQSFYSVKTIDSQPRDRDMYATYSQSLAHSACLIALRQEIWSVCLYRRPFRFPLCPDNDYTNFDEAVDDYTWTNRIIVWCADICKFCFGGGELDREQGNNSLEANFATRVERWKKLRAFQEKWDTVQPACFKPLYYREADPSQGRYFPEIWHMNDCQVMGLMHVELSRMLLAAYDPNLHRIGLGARSSLNTLEARLRRATLKLCGLASTKEKCQATMATAAIGVSMCGEYFHDPGEQGAIESFLKMLEQYHAWPTQGTLTALRDAWDGRRKHLDSTIGGTLHERNSV